MLCKINPQILDIAAQTTNDAARTAVGSLGTKPLCIYSLNRGIANAIAIMPVRTAISPKNVSGLSLA